ncbi:metallophosphoesterase [Nocardioides sp. cx-169]|uniref:metallophosphoesterase family protein n=1 Tax=Nocardioides sp. cx-169 TaxID=2899080 RepID=UPI001E383C39|nr:metallophosphoesterase [Nocardioides sp. cx-169]MCD4534477.1 metallophosphoesterase [Nocardioides sp. cx-169]
MTTRPALGPDLRRSRRRLAAVGVAAVAITATLTATAHPAERVETGPGRDVDGVVASPAPPAASPDYRFLSSPDFMNGDIADLRRSPRWKPGMPNSWNASYAQTVATVMDTFAAERPDDVLVAGDLVNGHWGQDASESGVFGPVGNDRQREAALKRAADFYYSHWRARFTQRGLDVHPSIGDHEIGDNPWHGETRRSRFHRAMVPTYKARFAEKIIRPGGYRMHPSGPAAKTAYATYLHPEVLLVSVDQFQSVRGDVRLRLDPQQLRWMDHVLGAAEARGTDWVIVQGHVPVALPVRAWGSSQLAYEGGTDSSFWQTMAEHRVDVYLNGEVHDTTLIHEDGIAQISHGGILGANSTVGGTNYVLGEVFGDTLWLRDNRFVVASADRSAKLWQTTPQGAPVVAKVFEPDPPVIGEVVLSADNQVLYRDGQFLPYDG